jgi:hypothetical protein
MLLVLKLGYAELHLGFLNDGHILLVRNCALYDRSKHNCEK